MWIFNFLYLVFGIIKFFGWVFDFIELCFFGILGLFFKNIISDLKNLFYLWKEMVKCIGF